MSYLFDSSAIFKAVAGNVIEVLPGNYTVELATYELGNILWKERIHHRRLRGGEAEELIKLIKDALSLMKVLSVDCHEEEVINVAEELELTFYDASYVYYVEKMSLTLITEDEKLMDKAKPRIKVSKLNSIL